MYKGMPHKSTALTAFSTIWQSFPPDAGPGTLEAVGSANPCSEERYDIPESETYDGSL